MLRQVISRHAVIVAALGLGLAKTACGNSPATSSAGGGGSGATVAAQNTAYNPTTITVPANTQVTITFVNKAVSRTRRHSTTTANPCRRTAGRLRR
jgi:hypothetical protein